MHLLKIMLVIKNCIFLPHIFSCSNFKNPKFICFKTIFVTLTHICTFFSFYNAIYQCTYNPAWCSFYDFIKCREFCAKNLSLSLSLQI